jgi:hypothetical protein
VANVVATGRSTYRGSTNVDHNRFRVLLVRSHYVGRSLSQPCPLNHLLHLQCQVLPPEAGTARWPVCLETVEILMKPIHDSMPFAEADAGIRLDLTQVLPGHYRRCPRHETHVGSVLPTS